LSAALAAARHPGVLLLDSPAARPHLKHFLTTFRPECVLPVGAPAGTKAERDAGLGVATAAPGPWDEGRAAPLAEALLPDADHAVVCPAEPRGLLLQAACLAGVLRAPLLVSHAQDDAAALRRRLERWRPRHVVLVGAAQQYRGTAPGGAVLRLADETAVREHYLRHLQKEGSVRNLVVANPSDRKKGLPPMSLLAPWVALRHRAALLLTEDSGTNTAALVTAAL